MSMIAAELEVHRDRADMEGLFNRYHAAWEAKDPDAIVALHSEDSTFVLRAGEDRVRGRAALRAHFATIFETYPGFRAEVHRLIVGAGHWVLDWTMVVDLTGSDGRPFTARIDLVDVVDVDAAGLVARKDVYADGAQLAAALGRAGVAR